MRDLSALPKAHLHLHLTGSMRPATARTLAAEHGLALPPGFPDNSTPDNSGPDNSSPGNSGPGNSGPGNSGAWPAGERDWATFQRFYDAARDTIQRPEDLRRVIAEAARSDADDGGVWLELQVNPTSFAVQFDLSFDGAVDLLLDAARQATAGTGLGIGLILAANWTRPPQQAEQLATLAARYAQRGVVGFGIADDDRLGQPEDFRWAFAIAREAGLLATPHSGFYAGPEHIAACVTELGAHRIGHGVTSVRDPRLLEELARRQVTLELCPSSYPPLEVVSSLEDVPLRRLYEAGVPVALGADDPLLFGVSLLGQYEIARDVLGFSDPELAELARQSIRASAASCGSTVDFLARIDAWLATAP